MGVELRELPRRSRESRVRKNRIFSSICWLVAGLSVCVLGILFGSILIQGVHHLDFDLLSAPPSRDPGAAGLGPAIWGSIGICAVCAVVALPLGVGSAIFLEEYKPRHRFLRRLHGMVQLNIANLAGVPSIVYGILGLTAFVSMFNLFPAADGPAVAVGASYFDEWVDLNDNYLTREVDSRRAAPTSLLDDMTLTNDDGDSITVTLLDPDGEIPDAAFEQPGYFFADDIEPQRVQIKHPWYVQIPFGRGVLAGGLTLMLVILPIVIVASQEAIRAVPASLREGASGLGATKWQVIRRIVLPSSMGGIMTGSILAMSRAIGEAAPILVIAGIVYITFRPAHLMDEFTAMPLQIYNWASRPQTDFHEVAASGIIVLLAVLLTFNAVAVTIRHKFHKSSQ